MTRLLAPLAGAAMVACLVWSAIAPTVEKITTALGA